jgi:hypothetical protein
MLPTGTELYYSAQLTGTNLFAEGDRSIAGLRMADLEASQSVRSRPQCPLSAEQRTARQPALKSRALNHNLSLAESVPGTIASPAHRG